MHFIGTLIIGFIVGIIAKAITPGRDPSGCIITIIIGIVGSFIATFLGRAMNWYAPDQPAGFIGSVIGAVILLAIYHLIRGKRAS